VYEFVSRLSANAPANNFKKIFRHSDFNNGKYSQLISKYDSLNIDLEYEYTAYPYGQKIGGSTESLLRKELISAIDLKDFRLKAIGIIPNADLQTLSEVLSAFEPVYQKLIYEPGKSTFMKQLCHLRKLIDSVNVVDYFDAGLKVYNASWDRSVPFQFVFYPMPGTRGFNATALYNIAISGLPADLTNYNKLLSVMLHEIFHIEYDEQSLVTKKNIEQWFIENPCKTSRYAYLLFNEAMATAMGNGYVYSQLNGIEDTAAWYNRKYTGAMAKKMYPLVKSYILNGKPIDQSFINTYIQLYNDNFSHWITEINNILTDRYVLSDNTKDFSVIDANYPYRSMAQYDSGVVPATIEKMKQAPITKIIIISKDNFHQLLLLKQAFKELKRWKPKANQDFNYAAWLSDKTYLLIMNEVKENTEWHLKTLEIK